MWKRNLARDDPPFDNQWGHGSSPMVYKDLLILLCDHRPVSYVLALDKATGKERWRVDRGRGRVSHTPVVVAGPKGDELIINSDQRIDAYKPATDGRSALACGHGQRQTPIPSAVSHGGTIYLSRGYRNSDILALRPGGTGDVSESHLKWRMPNGGSYVPSIVHYEGLLYMTNEVGVVTRARRRRARWCGAQRLGIFFASPVAADGKIYLLSETGEMFVLKAGRTAQVWHGMSWGRGFSLRRRFRRG